MTIRTALAARSCRTLLAFAGVILAGLTSVTATSSGGPTRLLRTPTISAAQIAFAYANNIWIVERARGMARRLTSFQGQTTNPHFTAKKIEGFFTPSPIALAVAVC